jgi:hypothetical protein
MSILQLETSPTLQSPSSAAKTSQQLPSMLRPPTPPALRSNAAAAAAAADKADDDLVSNASSESSASGACHAPQLARIPLPFLLFILLILLLLLLLLHLVLDLPLNMVKGIAKPSGCIRCGAAWLAGGELHVVDYGCDCDSDFGFDFCFGDFCVNDTVIGACDAGSLAAVVGVRGVFLVLMPGDVP